MGDELLSSTPNPSGNDKPAADESGRKQDAQPKEEIMPRRRQARKVFGFSEAKFREFAGYFILIPWLWYDLIDSHGQIGKLCFLAASLTVAQSLVCSFLKSFPKAITLWIISEIAVVMMVYENSRPELKPHPHFIFSMSTAYTPEDEVKLTNDFLIRQEDGRTNRSFSGLLMMPLPFGETNIPFAIELKNDSSEVAEDLLLVVILPKELVCVPSQGWQKTSVGASKFVSKDSTNEVQAWECRLPDILSGNGDATPPFQISVNITNTLTPFSILVRAKDSPATQISFRLVSFWIPTNFPSQKGFVMEVEKNSSNMVFLPPWKVIVKHLNE
jgi:hypothetical protein